MPSSYSSLKVELIALGEQVGAWGATTNTNLGTALEEAIIGRATANFPSDADLTLTLINSNASQEARNFVLNCTSSVSLTATRDLVVPAIQKPYIIQNNTTGDQSIRVIVAGASVTIPNGKTAFVYNDGTNVKTAFDYLVSPTFNNFTSTGDGTFSGTGQVKLPAGTTAQRSGSPTDGMVRYNNDLNSFEGYGNGSAAVTAAVSYGTTAGTTCQGNDSRLSDARQATNTNTQLASLGVGTAASGTAGEIRATNNITAYFSDDRLKTKLGNIEDALAKVRTLSGFYYQPNEVAESLGYEVVREVGVSAQQVQAVQPEIVVPAPIDDKYLTVRYERLVPLLIEAIKELDAELQSLKAKLKE
jgi:hypothetical protein